MNYDKKQLDIAKAEGLPLIKIEIDYRYVKDKTIRTTSLAGPASHEVAKKLRDIIIHDCN